MKTRIKLPDNYYNSLSYIGTGVAIISFVVFAIFAIFSHIFQIDTTYAGIITYVIIPIFIILGLILIPIGMWLKRRGDKKTGKVASTQLPIIDFNKKQTFNAFLIFFPATIILFIFTAYGTYQAYHFTESVNFCGTVCHKVMAPEYVTYQNSPHQRVSCVECHIGRGASWYVKSKLSGMYQLYSVAFDKYPRPINTPILKLRPARETCEECHWPEKYYPYTLRTEHHFLPDENNSRWDINLVLKTSAPVASEGLTQGIHWHINPNVSIEYIGLEGRQFIPWIKYTNLKTGEEVIYKQTNTEVADSVLAGGENRVMDCLDCHNRPSHSFKSPMKFINNELSAGTISRELPDVKAMAMGILYHLDINSTDSALMQIDSQVNDYYLSMYEDIYAEKKDLIDEAIGVLQAQFSKNIFPEMNARWDKYPNHIGHLENKGCFRCHDDEHKSENGRVISKDCNLCHIIIAQSGPDTSMVSNLNQPLEFFHMDDESQSWKETLCFECHSDLY